MEDHRRLDTEIKEYEKDYLLHDSTQELFLKIRELKKQKLLLKDRIACMEAKK